MDDLAQGILLLIKDGQLRRDMGQAAREVVRRFSLDSVMKKWLVRDRKFNVHRSVAFREIGRT